MDKSKLAEKFKIFTFGNAFGIGNWLSANMHDIVYDRLTQLEAKPLTKVQFNQLFVISKVPSISDGFFKYYWCSAPSASPQVRAIPEFDKRSLASQHICSLDQLYWGLYRLYIDSLFYFGNIEAGFNSLRSLNYDELVAFFVAKRFDTSGISTRGPALPLNSIAKDDRYLISEMACKTFGELPENTENALQILQNAWDKHTATGGGQIEFREFLKKYVVDPSNEEQILLSYDDISDSNIDSKISVKQQFDSVVTKFLAARKDAISNTEKYLSMVNDLDIYVATSMRNRKNFRDMAEACDRIFTNSRLNHLHLRYFDPTLSAARGHEDKGLIECLMVKCAKVLVYCEGEKESYGKDAEAAMALSLGKPVIFYCDHGKKTNFYREVHPLARLIDFRSGVAVGAIVSDEIDQISELLCRIFENRMEYRLEHHPKRPGYLKLIECLTNSVVRLQTNDELLTKTFWNNYHRCQDAHVPSLAAGKEAERLME